MHNKKEENEKQRGLTRLTYTVRRVNTITPNIKDQENNS
jgi:hypothetical protein